MLKNCTSLYIYSFVMVSTSSSWSIANCSNPKKYDFFMISMLYFYDNFIYYILLHWKLRCGNKFWKSSVFMMNLANFYLLDSISCVIYRSLNIYMKIKQNLWLMRKMTFYYRYHKSTVWHFMTLWPVQHHDSKFKITLDNNPLIYSY